MGDLASALATKAESETGSARAAVVADRPAQLQERLQALRSHLAAIREPVLDSKGGWFYHPDASGSRAGRIGFLFPGQGVPLHPDGGLWRRRFAAVRERYAKAELPTVSGSVGTEVAQPIIVTACLAALDLAGVLGITADVALGHSLGELVALHWAGVFDDQALLRVARARGKAIASVSGPRGAMASLAASAEEVRALCAGTSAVIAGLNSARQTVVSGQTEEVERVVQRAAVQGLHSVMLPVSHAFHSPLMEEAIPLLHNALRADRPASLRKTVVSTVTGAPLALNTNITDLLCDQLTGPVRFAEAFTAAQERIDLWLELGPGQILTGLTAATTSAPVLPLHAGGESLRGLLQGVGAAFVLGTVSHPAALYADRFVRPFPWDWQPQFFQNPCELAPLPASEAPENAGMEVECTDTPATVTMPPNDVNSASTREERPGNSGGTLETIRQLVAERTELPVSAIFGEHRFLADLHLNSITVGELMVRAARETGVPVPAMPLDFADASLADAAQMLDSGEPHSGKTLDEIDTLSPAGVAPWVESFTVEWIQTPLLPGRPPTNQGIWTVFAPPSCRWADAVRSAFAVAPSGGVVVCLPADRSNDSVDLLLASARALFAQEKAERYVVVQEDGIGAPFARTLSLEHPDIATCVVEVRWDHPEAAPLVVREALATEGFCEAKYDADGHRFEPRLRRLRPQAKAAITLGPNDLLLVSGGGKGIAAECALALAQRTGTRLLLLGRSDPQTDTELARNLTRLAEAGARYVRADVTDAAQVESALREAQAEIGPVTAILHGAGRNVPCPIRHLTAEAFHLTLATKVTGLQNMLAAIDPAGLRLLVSFGSLIARTGLPGEADYAVANAEMTALVEGWQAEHTYCRCLNLEWSVWAGAGMAERMGRVEALTRQGIMPISIDEGIARLMQILEQPASAISCVVTGRFGSIPTLKCEEASLPFQRFLEQPRVYYPDVELVVDSVLSADSDPYLNDHIFAGERLMPGVMALEAAAQVAMALARSTTPPSFEEVRFLRPTVVPANQTVTLRVAALQRLPGRVEIAIRSETTSFQADHVRLTCRFDTPVEIQEHAERLPSRLCDLREAFPIRSGSALYGTLLFQTGRFQRLNGYRLLRAKACVAEIGAPGTIPWFGPYLPDALVLGDAGARDAAIHLIQACIPHATLLPVGIGRLIPGQTPLAAPCLAMAKEISQEGDLFTYDLALYDREGSLCESWEGLQLRRVADRDPAATWPELLVGPYLERMLAAHLTPSPEIGAILTSSCQDSAVDATEQALQQLLSRPLQVRRRPDGKPEIEGRFTVSSAHCGSLTLAVAGTGALSCDAEAVVSRPADLWQDLLGSGGIALVERIVRETGEDSDSAATRVWAANECAKKVGRRHSPLLLEPATTSDWVNFSSGDLTIATYACHVSTRPERLVLAVAREC
ncbi:MAG: polyketide synthase family protein [Chthonomonadales bacterium]|nr:polyketide synthase family protein [Chthonomonadales bacterium]